MDRKKASGAAEWADPDDAPELTEAFFDEAEVTKQLISVRLDPDALAKLREAAPGWQSQINALLRQALGLGDASAR